MTLEQIISQLTIEEFINLFSYAQSANEIEQTTVAIRNMAWAASIESNSGGQENKFANSVHTVAILAASNTQEYAAIISNALKNGFGDIN